MARRQKKEARKTVTVKERVRGTKPADPVLAIRVFPKGRKLFSLSGKPLFSIGADTDTDILLEDETVSGVHCLLWVGNSQVTVEDNCSKNRTLVNGTLVDGQAELAPGDVLTVGQTTLLACGQAGMNQQPRACGRDLQEFLRHAQKLHGTLRRAAGALQIARETLSRWLRDNRFATTSKRDS